MKLPLLNEAHVSETKALLRKPKKSKLSLPHIDQKNIETDDEKPVWPFPSTPPSCRSLSSSVSDNDLIVHVEDSSHYRNPSTPNDFYALLPMELDTENAPSGMQDYDKSLNDGTRIKSKHVAHKFPARHPKQTFLVPFPAPLSVVRQPECSFSLQDFLIDLSNESHVPLQRVKQIVTSRATYKRITEAVAATLTTQSELSVQSLVPDMTPFQHRVPHTQLLLEVAQLVKLQMRQLLQKSLLLEDESKHALTTITGTEVRTFVRPLPRFSQQFFENVGPLPHAEIVLYEDDSALRRKKLARQLRESEVEQNYALIQGSSSSYFQGNARGGSPFGNDGFLRAHEQVVLESLLTGSGILNFKGYFIDQLPSLNPLIHTIVYLNLSYNNFTELPQEVCRMHQLQDLRLRNNPLQRISENISWLQKLKTFIASFCLLESIPLSFYRLKELTHVDISFNHLAHIDSEIMQLKHLQDLNLEGNPLWGLPAAALTITLRSLRVQGTFMERVFWKDALISSPPTLAELSLQKISSAVKLRRQLPAKLQLTIARSPLCDCCQGPRIVPGFRILRSCRKRFGVRNLPFIFLACSATCARNFAVSHDYLDYYIYGDTDALDDEEKPPSPTKEINIPHYTAEPRLDVQSRVSESTDSLASPRMN